MATPKENKSWKSGRKGGRKKKAKPQVLGLVLAICGLAGVLLWAIWPRPMVQVQLFVISSGEEIPFDGEQLVRYKTAKSDNQAILGVFSKLAEQVQSVIGAKEIPVSTFRGMPPEDLDGNRRVGIFFLNAFARVQQDDQQATQLVFEFGTDRQVLSFAELAAKLDAAKFREVILLLEVAHERPGFSSGLLALEGTALLEEEVSLLAETMPNLKLTVISSATPLNSSYPHIVAASELPDLKDFDPNREVILGTVFGQSVAKVFQAGDFWTISELGEQITSHVESYVKEKFRGDQTPQIISSYSTDKPVEIFREIHVVTSESAAEKSDEEAPTDEAPPEKTAEDQTKQSPDDLLVEFRGKVDGIVQSFEVAALSVHDLMHLSQLSSDMKYCLDHGDLNTFEEILNQGERLVLQIKSSIKTGIDVQQGEQMHQWIPPLNTDERSDGSFFSEVLAEVNEGEDQRSAKVVEKLKTQEARDLLVASFLEGCQLSLDEIDNDSPEAIAQRVEQLAEWKKFFQRFAKKAGWHDSEWSHQLLIASDLLKGLTTDWSDEQFAAFLRLQLLRSKGVQFASGWTADGQNRLDQGTFQQLEPELKSLLNEIMAAERWFLLGQNALGLLEKHLLLAEKHLAEVKMSLGEAGDRYNFLTQQRLKVLSSVPQIAALHDSVVLSPDQLSSLSRLTDTDLLGFSPVNFPQASFSRKVSRDDAIALLQLTTRLTANSPRQQMNETESAMSRFRGLDDAAKVISASEEYQTPMVHQGVWLGFWSIRSLQSLSDKVDIAPLLTSWIELVQAIADEKETSVIAAKRTSLAQQLVQQWSSISKTPVVLFQPVNSKSVQALISKDLEQHAVLAGSRYSGRYRKIFEHSIDHSGALSLPILEDEIKVVKGEAELALEIPEGAQVYFYSPGVRLKNSNLRDIDGWQVGPWSRQQRGLEVTSQFTGSANPVIAVVNQDGIVQDFQKLQIGVAFEATGWKVRFLSKGIRVPEIDLSDHDKVIKLPPQTGEEPLPLTVLLLQPETSFAKSVMVNIAPLGPAGEPGKLLWPQFQELTLDPKTKSVEVPLFPAVPEGEANPVQIPADGLDFTQGIAFFVRPSGSASRTDDVVLKVTPKFYNPLDQYLELGQLEFDTQRHKLSVPIRRRSGISADSFPPEKIGGELNFSLDLDPYSLNPPPKRPEITENFEILEATFAPQIQDAIRISETTIGKDRLEFGLSVNGLENIAKWRLGQSEKMERIGYARSGNANQFGSRTEIRIGMNLVNNKDDGVLTHNLKGQFVLAEKWKNALLDLPLELYGYMAEQANASRLELSLLKEGGVEPLTLASLRVIDAYERSVKVNSEEPGLWLIKIASKPHGKFQVNLFENFRVTEGTHKLVATLKDENNSQPIAEYQTDLIIEDSAPSIRWRANNPKEVLTSQNYLGWLEIEDPQTGVASVAVGLGKESMTTIDLKDKSGEKRELKVPFLLEKLLYPEIPAKNVPIKKRITVLVEATNSIGMVNSFTHDLDLVQPAANMSPAGEKTGTLLVKISSKGKYDLVLTGAGGKIKRELPDSEGTAQFDDLPEGNYQLNWTKNYDNSKGAKPVVLKFQMNGEVFNLSL